MTYLSVDPQETGWRVLPTMGRPRKQDGVFYVQCLKKEGEERVG